MKNSIKKQKELEYRTIAEREYKQARTITTTPEQYREYLDEFLTEGEPILSHDKEEWIQAEDEIIAQMYVKGDPVRCEFPYNWFLTNKGNLLTVSSKGGLVKWKKPVKDDKGRYLWNFTIYKDANIESSRTIRVQNAVGLVFGSERFGWSNELLKQYGLDAIKYQLVEGHHKDRDKTNNSPDNIEFLTGQGLEKYKGKIGLHGTLRKLNRKEMTDEEERNVLHAISEETDGKPFVVFTGQAYDPKTESQSDCDAEIIHPRSIWVTKEAYEQLISNIMRP